MSEDFPDGMTPQQVWQYIFFTLSKYSQGVLAFCAILFVPLFIVMSVYLVRYANDVRKLADQTQSRIAFPANFESKPPASDQPKAYNSKLGEAFGPPTWSNWAIVLVAIFAAVIANRTLNAIKRQADLIQDQTKSAKDRERARLEVLFPPEPLDLNAHWDLIPNGVPFETFVSVVNHGYTKAFNVRASGVLNIVQSEKTVLAYDGCDLSISRVIKDGDEAETVPLSPMGSFFVIDQRLIDQVQDYSEDDSKDDSYWINQSPDAT